MRLVWVIKLFYGQKQAQINFKPRNHNFGKYFFIYLAFGNKTDFLNFQEDRKTKTTNGPIKLIVIVLR